MQWQFNFAHSSDVLILSSNYMCNSAEFFELLLTRAAFFRGQIEERCTSRIASWFSRGDLEIVIAVSSIGVYLIEPKEGVTQSFLFD